MNKIFKKDKSKTFFCDMWISNFHKTLRPWWFLATTWKTNNSIVSFRWGVQNKTKFFFKSLDNLSFKENPHIYKSSFTGNNISITETTRRFSDRHFRNTCFNPLPFYYLSSSVILSATKQKWFSSVKFSNWFSCSEKKLELFSVDGWSCWSCSMGLCFYLIDSLCKVQHLNYIEY